jgi:membrane-associated protein
LLVTAGVLAAAGFLDIVWLNLLLCACAILGDAVGYQIGLRMGPRIFKRPKSLLFNPKHLEWTRGFYERHGGKTIVLARFMPIARTFAPVVAGMGRMGYRRFATFNVAGGVAWILSFTLGGYWLARIIPDAQRYLHIVVAVVIFLSILPGIIAYARARWSRPRATAEPAE